MLVLSRVTIRPSTQRTLYFQTTWKVRETSAPKSIAICLLRSYRCQLLAQQIQRLKRHEPLDFAPRRADGEAQSLHGTDMAGRGATPGHPHLAQHALIVAARGQPPRRDQQGAGVPAAG